MGTLVEVAAVTLDPPNAMNATAPALLKIRNEREGIPEGNATLAELVVADMLTVDVLVMANGA